MLNCLLQPLGYKLMTCTLQYVVQSYLPTDMKLMLHTHEKSKFLKTRFQYQRDQIWTNLRIFLQQIIFSVAY